MTAGCGHREDVPAPVAVHTAPSVNAASAPAAGAPAVSDAERYKALQQQNPQIVPYARK